MLFVSTKKLFLFTMYSRFCNPFLDLSTVFRFKVSDQTGIIMMSRIGLYELAIVVFGINQKPLCIKSSKLPR